MGDMNGLTISNLYQIGIPNSRLHCVQNHMIFTNFFEKKLKSDNYIAEKHPLFCTVDFALNRLQFQGDAFRVKQSRAGRATAAFRSPSSVTEFLTVPTKAMKHFVLSGLYFED